MEGEPRSKRVDRPILTVVLSALIAVSSVIFLILLSFIKKVGGLGEAVKLRLLERRYTDFPQQKSLLICFVP